VIAMKSSYAKYGIGPLCVLFGKTRHAFYDKSWYQEERIEATHLVLEMVAEIRREMPRIGSNKVYKMLRKPFISHGIKMGRDALHDLLLEQGLTVKRRRRYVTTTDSNHWMKKYPNLIKELVFADPEQLIVADITYITVDDDFNFLSLITDAYSKLIMGYCLHPTLAAAGSVNALNMALAQRTKTGRLIHHSDRGVQYCCNDYVSILKSAEIAISMTENGDPYENAIAERVNGILKTEFDLSRKFATRAEALEAVENSIRIYNTRRPHMSCDYLTPAEAHKMTGILEKKWKPKTYSKTLEPAV